MENRIAVENSISLPLTINRFSVDRIIPRREELLKFLSDDKTSPIFLEVPPNDNYDSEPEARRIQIDEFNNSSIETRNLVNSSVLSQLREAGIDLFDGAERNRITNILRSLDRGEPFPPNTPDAMKGFDGCSVNQFLKRLLFLETRCLVFGKIRDYVFELQRGPFAAKPHIAEGRGHIGVEVVTETFNNDQSFSNGNPDRRELLHWDIAIEDYGYRVFERQGSAESPNNDPFPGTVDFPPEATNPANSLSVWCRGLDHKLFASSDAIRIERVYRQIDCGRLNLLPDTDELYQIKLESCVDLMFKGFPPATQLPEQSGYCLGRCEHPGIVNSAGT